MANVAEHRITALPGPPAIYQTFLAHPDLDLDRVQSLRLAVTGAAPVPVELIERMERELGFETVVTAYGLTETCGTSEERRAGKECVSTWRTRWSPDQ